MNNDDEQFEIELRTALTARSAGPSQHDIDRIRQFAESRPPTRTPSAGARRRPATVWAVVAVAASLVAAFVAGTRLSGDDTPAAAGVAEFNETLQLQGSGSIQVAGRKLGIGRTVAIQTDALPILPTGDFYEVWFIGAGDSPATPNRISAGTFHPDAAGNTDIVLTAAVDPTKFPVLAITAEPADGNPAASGTEVARGELTVITD